MSAPLVVNTLDGTVWTLREGMRGGEALYAPEKCGQCPQFVMATLTELAEHGIAGSADVLPVPVGPESKPLVLDEAQVEALAEAGNRVVNDAVHEDLCMCDGWPEKCVSSGGFRLGDWDVSGLETALPAVLALWEQMRGGELATLRARVAELEGQLAAKDRPVDEDPIAYALTEKAEAECDHPNGYGPYGCAGCGAFRPPADDEDVTPQVQRLRALLAGQRDAVAAETGGE